MPDQPFDYEACLAACVKGDALYLERLHQIEAPLMQAQCEEILGDKAQAEDAVRETFIQVWQQARRYEHSQGSAREWIYSIMRRHVEQRRARSATPTRATQDHTPTQGLKQRSASVASAAHFPASDDSRQTEHATVSYQPLLRKEAIQEPPANAPVISAVDASSAPPKAAPTAQRADSKVRKSANAERQQRTRASGGWSNVWFWRILSLGLAIFAVTAVILAPPRVPSPSEAASLLPASEPTPTIAQVAVLQAPGSTSTPGWVLTVDSRQNLMLTPQVNIEVPDTSSIYLWTHNEGEGQPRRLGLIDPTQSLTLPAEVAGLVRPGQIFEMTQEPNTDSQPLEPNGPILFIGRTIKLG